MSLTNPSPFGFLLGLVFAGAEFFFSNTNQAPGYTESFWAPLLALLFLPALGAILPRLMGARPLLVLMAVSFLFLLGQNAALGASAKTWVGASWWCWIFPILFLIVLCILKGLPVDSRFSLFVSLVILWLATSQIPAQYKLLAEDLSCFAFAFGLLAITPSKKNTANSLVLPGLSFALLLLSLSTIAMSETVARWSLDQGVISSWMASQLRQSSSPPPVAPKNSSNAPNYFDSPLQKLCTQERDREFGKTKGVLFITIDALRFDMLGRSHNGLSLTPFLDTLATTAISMDRAYSPAAISHWTLFSAFSGLLPGQIIGYEEGLDGVPLICDRLEEQGVATRASFSKRVHNARSRRLDFNREDLGFRSATLHDLDPTIDQVIGAVMPHRSDQRWFSYVHLMTPHAPYDAAPENLSRGSSDFDRYCAEVRLADRQVQEIITAFRNKNHKEGTWVIISADHGEAFGEHGAFFHGSNLYQEAIHVPLLICPPKAKESRRVDSCLSLTDLAPTLDDLFDLGWKSRPAYAGRSWLPLILGRDDPQRLNQAIAESPPISLGRDKNLVTIVTPKDKLILDRDHDIRWLFDLEADPRENRNVVDRFPERAADLMTRLMQAGAPPIQADILGRYLSIMEALEDKEAEDVLPFALSTLKSDPESLSVFTCWFLTHRPSPETKRFIAHLGESRNEETAESCLRLLSLLTRWDETRAKELLQVLKDPFLLFGTYALLTQHKVFDLPRIPQEVQEGETLPVTLIRTRNDVGNDSYSKPSFKHVQRLIERGLSAKNTWIRRLTYELIGASQHPGSVPFLLLAEEKSKSIPERLAILKALSSFESVAIAERLKRLANHSHTSIRDFVFRTWFAGRNLPALGVRLCKPTSTDRFPTELELTAHHKTITVVSKIRASGATRQVVKFLWSRSTVEMEIDTQFDQDFIQSFTVSRGTKNIRVILLDADPRTTPIRLESFLVIDNN